MRLLSPGLTSTLSTSSSLVTPSGQSFRKNTLKCLPDALRKWTSAKKKMEGCVVRIYPPMNYQRQYPFKNLVSGWFRMLGRLDKGKIPQNIHAVFSFIPHQQFTMIHIYCKLCYHWGELLDLMFDNSADNLFNLPINWNFVWVDSWPARIFDLLLLWRQQSLFFQ